MGGLCGARLTVCSVFGRAYAGLDVIHSIENVQVDNKDKPFDDVVMVSLEVS